MAYVNQGGVIFFGTTTSKFSVVPGEENPDGQFWLWSPLMIFSLVMACLVGLIILILLLYFLFYYCVYGTCCCPGMGCWWCPQAAPAVQEEPVKIRVRRPSRSDSCRSSVRSRSSSVCSHHDHDDRKLVRVNSCPSINGSVMGVQPMIIQTIPAIQAAPQVYQQPLIQAAPLPLPPPAPPVQSGFGGGELRVVIGEGKPAASSSRSDNVIVYDMARSNGSGITLGGGGGRREYELTSVDDFGGTYRAGAFNGGFDRDDGSFLSEGHRSAVIDIGRGGGNFYPSLPQYDD